MTATNLRGGLSDLVNSLNKARNNCTDPAQATDLQKLIRVHMLLREEVIHQTLDSNTAAYQEALTAVNEAEKHAQTAVTDINRMAEMIAKATKAAQSVDKVVQVLAPVLKA
jgi:hypothetical protein